MPLRGSMPPTASRSGRGSAPTRARRAARCSAAIGGKRAGSTPLLTTVGVDAVLVAQDRLPLAAHDQHDVGLLDRADLAVDQRGAGEVVDVVHGAHDRDGRALVAQRGSRPRGDAVLRVEDVELADEGTQAGRERVARGEHALVERGGGGRWGDDHVRDADRAEEPVPRVVAGADRDDRDVLALRLQRLGQRQRVHHPTARSRRVGEQREPPAHFGLFPGPALHSPRGALRGTAISGHLLAGCRGAAASGRWCGGPGGVMGDRRRARGGAGRSRRRRGRRGRG